MPTASAIDAEPTIRAAFLRRTLGQLACAAGLFVVTAAIVAFLLPYGVVRGWMRDTPLAVALIALSLGAAWSARWWADVDAPRPIVALNLLAAFQAVVLAPLVPVAFDWLGVWMTLPAALILVSLLAAIRRVTRFHLPSQSAAAALALSAAPAEPVWFAWRMLRCVVCRD